MAVRLPVPTDPSSVAVLERQAALMFTLAEQVLADLTLDECLWTTTSSSWNVQERDGRWFGGIWEETDDLASPSLGWTTWHPIWWLSALLASQRGEERPEPDAVEWPGPAQALPTIRRLWHEWTELLGGLDESQLASRVGSRWPYEDDRPLIHLAGWASMELTKNLSEMCLLRRVQRDLNPSRR